MVDDGQAFDDLDNPQGNGMGDEDAFVPTRASSSEDGDDEGGDMDDEQEEPKIKKKARKTKDLRNAVKAYQRLPMGRPQLGEKVRTKALLISHTH